MAHWRSARSTVDAEQAPFFALLWAAGATRASPVAGARHGGGIHELVTLTAEQGRIRDLQRELSQPVRVGAQPMPAVEWRRLLRDAGLEVIGAEELTLRLLTVRSLLADVGL